MNRGLLLRFLLLLFGVVSVLELYSVSPQDGKSQLVFVGLGLAATFVVPLIPRRLIRRSIPLVYGITMLLLCGTLLLGHRTKGAQRWVNLGPVGIQVSELAKPVLALTLATLAVHVPLKKQKHLAIFFAVAVPIISLVLIQPDLGSSLVLAVITGSIVFFAVAKFSLLLPWGAIFLCCGLLIWQFGLHAYQKQRLFSFLGLESSPTATYNARQAVITVGSGKVWGRGIGHGVQTNLRFLPEFHTDFFFAAFAEENGLVGVATLFLLYMLFFGILLWGISDLEPFDKIFRFSFFWAVFFQAFVHIAMNIGLAPVTGIPLPFLSSGGSSFVSLALFLGLALRFDRESEKRRSFIEIGT